MNYTSADALTEYQLLVERAKATIAELRSDLPPDEEHLTVEQLRRKYLYPAKSILWALANFPQSLPLRIELQDEITEFARVCNYLERQRKQRSRA
jgi:hypothetical protein